MAGKKASLTVDNNSSLLIKSHEVFKEELQERIELGNTLHSKIVNNQQEYAEINKDFDFWNNYNLELLKRSFSVNNNEYYKEYDYSPTTILPIRKSYGSQPSPPSFQELIVKMKGKLHEKINRLQKIKEKIYLIQTEYTKEPIKQKIDRTVETNNNLNIIFNRFHKVAQSLRRRHGNRPTIILTDEYDVQDLLKGLLHIYFNDIRPEDFTPNSVGGNSRIDFSLREEETIIEVKMTNDRLSDKQIGEQILIDIGRYKNHPHCKNFIVFIYDKGDYIINKRGLIDDLERESSDIMIVKVYIKPD